MTTTDKKRAGGRTPAPPLRKPDETDAAFAARIVAQERARVRHLGGPEVEAQRQIVADLQAVRDELRAAVQQLGVAQTTVEKAAAAQPVLGASSTDPTTAWAEAAAARHRERAVVAERDALATLARVETTAADWFPLGWLARARNVWCTLSGRQPDAAEELALESNWGVALRSFGTWQNPNQTLEAQVEDDPRWTALSWFATACAAFLQEHPREGALQWLKQLQRQLDLPIRSWDADQLLFRDDPRWQAGHG
jgi:hypothetical protein